MRALAAMLLVLATIGWAVVAQAGLFPYVEGLGTYSLVDGLIVTIIYMLAPLVLAVAWSLLLQRRLPTRNQIKKVGLAAVILAVFVALAIPVGYGIGWLVDNTSL